MLTLCLSARRKFCHLLMMVANSLDPDQAQQYVGPDLDPSCLDVIPERIFEKSNDVNDLQVTKTIMKNYATCKELNV